MRRTRLRVSANMFATSRLLESQVGVTGAVPTTSRSSRIAETDALRISACAGVKFDRISREIVDELPDDRSFDALECLAARGFCDPNVFGDLGQRTGAWYVVITAFDRLEQHLSLPLGERLTRVQPLLNVLDVELRTDTSGIFPKSATRVGAGDVDSSHSVLDLDGHLDRDAGLPCSRHQQRCMCLDGRWQPPSLNAITETSSIVS